MFHGILLCFDVLVCVVSDVSLSFSQVLAAGRVLSLASALVSDTGRYTCVAVNAGGEQHREYHLRVYGEKNSNATILNIYMY